MKTAQALRSRQKLIYPFPIWMVSAVFLEIRPGSHRVLGLLGDHARKLLERSLCQSLRGPISLSLPLGLIASVILDIAMDSIVNPAPLPDQSALMKMI